MTTSTYRAGKGVDDGGPELKPCPFCGGEAKVWPDEIGSGGQHVTPYHAGCPLGGGCGICFTEEWEEDAIAEWNRRAPTHSALTEPDYAAEMRLPDGVTCADCRHIRRCAAFGFSEPERTSCDFWPSRFIAARAALAKADTTEKNDER